VTFLLISSGVSILWGLKFAYSHRNWRSPLTLSELPFWTTVQTVILNFCLTERTYRNPTTQNFVRIAQGACRYCIAPRRWCILISSCCCCFRSWRGSVARPVRIAPISAATWCVTSGTSTRRWRVPPGCRSWTRSVRPPRWPTTWTRGRGRSSFSTLDADDVVLGVRRSKAARRPTTSPCCRHIAAAPPFSPSRRLASTASSLRHPKSSAANLRKRLDQKTGLSSTLQITTTVVRLHQVNATDVTQMNRHCRRRTGPVAVKPWQRWAGARWPRVVAATAAIASTTARKPVSPQTRTLLVRLSPWIVTGVGCVSARIAGTLAVVRRRRCLDAASTSVPAQRRPATWLL